MLMASAHRGKKRRSFGHGLLWGRLCDEATSMLDVHGQTERYHDGSFVGLLC
jgi:hypothetical protein